MEKECILDLYEKLGREEAIEFCSGIITGGKITAIIMITVVFTAFCAFIINISL